MAFGDPNQPGQTGLMQQVDPNKPTDPLGQLQNLLTGGGQQQQPRQGEPFLPFTQGRGPEEWGRPDWILNGARGYPGVSPGPLMPQIGDVLGIYRNNMFNLGRWGSPLVGQNALQAMIFRGNFEKAYQQGLMQRAKYEKEMADFHQDEVERHQIEASQAYGQRFAVYGSKDPTNYGDKAAPGDTLYDQLYHAAQERNDHMMIAALETRGVKGAYELNQWNDHNLGPLMKVTAQRDADRRAEDANVRAQEKAEREKREEPIKTSKEIAQTHEAEARAKALETKGGAYPAADEGAPGTSGAATNVGGQIDPVTGKTSEQTQQEEQAGTAGAGAPARAAPTPSADEAAAGTTDEGQPTGGTAAGAAPAATGGPAPTAPAAPAPAAAPGARGAPTTAGQAARPEEEKPTTGDITAAKDVGETGAKPPAAKPPTAAPAGTVGAEPAVTYPNWSANNPANPRAGKPPSAQDGAEGMRLLMGGTANQHTPQTAITYANERHQDAASIIGSNLHGQAAVDYLTQHAGKEMAERARAQAYGEVPPAVGQYGGGGAHPLPQLLDALSKQINPNYTDQNYAWLNDLQKGNGRQGSLFVRSQGTIEAARQVYLWLGRVQGKEGSVPANWLTMTEQELAGRPEIAGLRIAVSELASESAGIARNSGLAEADIKRYLPGIGASASAIRAAISTSMANNMARFKPVRAEIERLTGQAHIRGMGDTMFDVGDYMSSGVDPYTGQPFPGRTPPPDMYMDFYNAKTKKTESTLLGPSGHMPLPESPEMKQQVQKAEAVESVKGMSPEERYNTAAGNLQGMSRTEQDKWRAWAQKPENRDTPSGQDVRKFFNIP